MEDEAAEVSTEKFGRSFSNVISIKETEIKKGDWLLVSFVLETSKPGCSTNNLRFYICKAVRKTSNESLEPFLRQKITREFLGHVYQFPDIEELTKSL